MVSKSEMIDYGLPESERAQLHRLMEVQELRRAILEMEAEDTAELLALIDSEVKTANKSGVLVDVTAIDEAILGNHQLARQLSRSLESFRYRQSAALEGLLSKDGRLSQEKSRSSIVRRRNSSETR